MSLALRDEVGPRTVRLSVLVAAGEAEEIARRSAAAGLSVSGFLRARALGDGGPEDAAALRTIDAQIARMERDLDGAIAALQVALGRP